MGRIRVVVVSENKLDSSSMVAYRQGSGAPFICSAFCFAGVLLACAYILRRKLASGVAFLSLSLSSLARA